MAGGGGSAECPLWTATEEQRDMCQIFCSVTNEVVEQTLSMSVSDSGRKVERLYW